MMTGDAGRAEAARRHPAIVDQVQRGRRSRLVQPGCRWRVSWRPTRTSVRAPRGRP
jgi:hypothetical protein